MLTNVKFPEGTVDMRFSTLLVGLVASSLVAAPALANPASSLSVANARVVKAATSPKKANKLSPAVGIVAVGALLIGGALLIDDDDKADSN